MTWWSHQQYRSFFQQTLPHLGRRAERERDESLEATFVELADLHDQLANGENQIVYGRRGTGKTHALAHLRSKLIQSGADCISLDLRTIGSAGGYYLSTDDGRRLAAMRVMVDFLAAIHEQVYEISLRLLQDGRDYERLVRAMDRLAEGASAISIDGMLEVSQGRLDSARSTHGGAFGLDTELSVSMTSEEEARYEASSSSKQTGSQRPALNISQLQNAVSEMVAALPQERLWVLIDEWSALPLDIQPLIADFIRRVLLPCRGLVLKIAAVERRSRFWHQTASGYVGFELGGDIFTGLDLDDYITRLMTPTHPDIGFYRTLLVRHAQELAKERGLDYDYKNFLDHAAIEEAIPDLREAIFFAGGNPRDFLSIASMASNRAGHTEAITFDVIALAARQFYVQAKESQARLLPSTRKLSAELRDYSASGGRRFMVDHDYGSDAVYDLLDQRLVHLLDRSVGPGGKFDIYAIDLGMYSDVLADEGYLRDADNPWANWDHVKTRNKLAPILQFDDHRATWG